MCCGIQPQKSYSTFGSSLEMGGQNWSNLSCGSQPWGAPAMILSPGTHAFVQSPPVRVGWTGDPLLINECGGSDGTCFQQRHLKDSELLLAVALLFSPLHALMQAGCHVLCCPVQSPTRRRAEGSLGQTATRSWGPQSKSPWNQTLTTAMEQVRKPCPPQPSLPMRAQPQLMMREQDTQLCHPGSLRHGSVRCFSRVSFGVICFIALDKSIPPPWISLLRNIHLSI